MSANEPDWSEADASVIHTAEELIQKYHPHLQQARICFIFRKEAQSVKGFDVMGGVAKIAAKEQVVLDYDFLIWISKEDWERIDTAKRMALIDHQLCHIWFGDSGLTIIGHDIEEFGQVIERHGLWNGKLKNIDTSLAKYWVQEGLLAEEYINRGRVGTISKIMDKISEVTISGAGKSVTMTGEQFDNLAGDINDNAHDD